MKWDFVSESNLVLAVESYGSNWKKISEEIFKGFPPDKLRNKYYKMRQRGLLDNYTSVRLPCAENARIGSEQVAESQIDSRELQKLVQKMLKTM